MTATTPRVGTTSGRGTAVSDGDNLVGSGTGCPANGTGPYGIGQRVFGVPAGAGQRDPVDAQPVVDGDVPGHRAVDDLVVAGIVDEGGIAFVTELTEAHGNWGATWTVECWEPLSISPSFSWRRVTPCMAWCGAPAASDDPG